MRKLKFSKEDLAKIKNAIKQSEKKTYGEIVPVIVNESDSYAIYELLFALFAGVIYFFVMLFFASGVEKVLSKYFWDYSNIYLVSFYGFSTFLLIAFVYLVSNISFIDRLIIPKKIMALKVRQRAVRYFAEKGIYATKNNTGILIFISKLEKRVELLADKGINSKIDNDKWDDIVKLLVEGIKKGEITEYLCKAIYECSELLIKHFPGKSNSENELLDELDILEG